MKSGIIGCGLIGQKRADAINGHEIAAVSDIDAARAGNLAKQHGATAYPDWRQLVESKLDAVIVATTHDHLSEIAVAALDAGKHVLVEKPAGRTLREAQAIADAAARNGRIAMVGFNHRFHPAMQKAHEIAASGALGPMMFLRGRYGHGGRVGYEKEWRFQKSISGGGELIDQGAHLIDLARWFLGDLEVSFAATPTYFWDAEVEDNCFLALGGKQGEMAWLHATWTEWKNMFSLEIYGRDGKLAIDGLGGSYGPEKLTWYKMKPEMGPPDIESWDFDGPDGSWARQFEEFTRAIAEQREPVGNAKDAVEMAKIVEECYRRSGS